jgi:DNA (cytosine-5)-methyltransferase 1
VEPIRRWERCLGRPAPAPTEPGSKGQPRLSPAFVEFLMGLPAGWVTDVPGLSRNDQLKALGNGVVPQQAAAAVRFLLARLAEERRWAA